MDNVIWKVIPFTDGYYFASDLGGIKMIDNVLTGVDGRLIYRKAKELKITKQKNGYLNTSIRIFGKSQKYGVHRLIALAFHPNADLSLEVLHKNNIKDDNRAINLRWGTQKQNVEDALRDGLRGMAWEHQFSKHSAAIYMQMFFLDSIGANNSTICKSLNLPSSTVLNAIANYKKYKEAINNMFLQKK
jgi:hypothetical protein